MRTWPTFSIRRRKGAVLAAFILLLLAAAALSIRFGSSSLSFSQVLEALAGKGTGTAASIVRHVRLPRTLAAMLAGAALAVSGVLLQAVLHNPLAGPHIIGVNAGSGFFVLGLTALWPHRPSLVPAAAFAGALLACLLIYALAVGTGASRITIVLAGVAVSGLFGAGSDALTTLFPDAAVGSNTFRMGGFSGVTMQAVGFALPYILAGLALALLLSYDMNVLALGEETAQGWACGSGSTGLCCWCWPPYWRGARCLWAGCCPSWGCSRPTSSGCCWVGITDGRYPARPCWAAPSCLYATGWRGCCSPPMSCRWGFCSISWAFPSFCSFYSGKGGGRHDHFPSDRRLSRDGGGQGSVADPPPGRNHGAGRPQRLR